MLRNSFDPQKPWRAVVYARMSSDRQNPRSPEQQLATIKETMKRLGYSWHLVEVYRDDAVSGLLTRRRPGLQKMLGELKSKRVRADLVLVDTFERLTRSEEGMDIRRELARAGALVLTADSNFADPGSTPGKALAFVESLRSTEDGRVKAHNVLRGKKDAVRLKHWPGGATPLGYRLRNIMGVQNGIEVITHREPEPDPATRWVAELIFQLADEQGLGTTRIARALNGDSRVPGDLKQFSPATIGEILDNELYTGTMVWGKNCTGVVDDVRVLQSLPQSEWLIVPDFCEPIISRDRWDCVQALRRRRRERFLEARAAKKNGQTAPVVRTPGVALKYLLSGLVCCGECGRSMVASSCKPYMTTGGEERRYVAYVCPGYAGGQCCNDRRVPEPWLRETVVNLVKQRLLFEA